VRRLEKATLSVHEHPVWVRRVARDVRVIERPLHQVVPVIHQLPGLPPVIGAVESLGRRLRLDQGVDPVRVRRRDPQVDLADEPLRHVLTAEDLLPGLASIRALPDSVPAGGGAAADDRPWLPLTAPSASVEDLRVLRMHLDIDYAD